MKTMLCWLATIVVVVFSSLSAHAQERTFTSDELDQAARDYENYLKSEWSTAGADARGWLAKGNAALKKSEFRQATGSFAAAAVLEGANIEAWTGLARAYLAIKTDDYKEKQSFPRSASSAAYLAYTRAKKPGQKAAALVLLSDALVRRSDWRPALEALKVALTLTASPGEALAIKGNFEKLRAEHGFRYLDYSVDNEAASPRLCLQFSEMLSPHETDFSKFVTLNGTAAPPVKVERRQLCLEDLTHGNRYKVKVRTGLPSVIEDEPLAKPVELTVYVRDRKPAVHFTGRSYVLPRSGQQGLPIVTVNTSRVDVEIYRVGDRRLAVDVLEGEFGSSLGPYALSRIKDEHGEKLWSGSMPVKPDMNEEVTTAFPVDELLPNLKPGLYLMAATPADGNGNSQDTVTQWFIVSDLGVTAMSGNDGINGFVRSLATGKALAGIEVRLVARNNEILGTVKTDASGHVLFEAGLTKGTAGQAPALLVARGQDSDYAFLDLTKSAFDLSDRGVGGRQAPGALDAMLFSERGVYRAGETVYLTALLRDQAAMAANVPLTLKVIRPDGVEFRREVLAGHADGGRSFALALPQESMTGTWRVSAYADPKGASIGKTTFLVEDYTPERLEMTVEPQAKIIAAGEPASIALKGRYLYGAPAAGLTLDGEVVVVPSPSGLPGYPGFHFGKDTDDFAPVRQPLVNLPVTGAEGEATISVSLPALPDTAQPLEARTLIRLHEASGRFIEKGVVLPVKPRQMGIGIKPLFDGGHVKDGDPAGFEVVAVDTAGKQVALSHMKWELFKLETRFQWYNRNGNWDYQSVDYVRKMANGSLDVDGATPAKLSVPVSYGAYRLEVTADGQPTVTSSLRFNSGWYVSDGADTPDILEVALDKASYQPGDAVKVTVLPRMAGEAMIAVVSDRLIEMKTVPVTDKGGETSFTVGKDWGPGAYIMAVAYRPMDEKAKRMPSRAVGVKWLPLDAKARTLAIDLKPAEKTLPNHKMVLPVSLSGIKPGETAHVTVAAVDVGILNVTNYKAPEPDAYYFGQRRLGAELRDLYGHLIDGMQGTRGTIRSGGDGIAMRGRPLTTEPVALYSGIVDVPASGTVEIPFDVPAFDGSLRLMAVAWTGSGVGHAVKDIIVRDAVILSATPPRFLTLGDTSEVHVNLHNVEGAAGSYDLAVTMEGGLAVPAGAEKRQIELKAGEQTNLSVPLNAEKLGASKVSLTLSGPDGFSATRGFKLTVEPAAPDVTRHSVATLAAKTGALTLNAELVAGLVPETAKVTLNVSRGAGMDVPGLLLALDRYPYGCAEQTVSRALPLLYYNELAEASGLAGEKGARGRIEKSIQRLASLQDSSGNFGLWSAGGRDVWLTAYVSDFLLRAKEKGYTVPPVMLTTALDRLKNSASATQEFESGGEELAYALYVLARAGKAVIGDLRYYADERIENFATPLARAQIGAALAMYGDKERAERAFSAALGSLKTLPGAEFLAQRTDYGTTLRDDAAALTLISESGTMHGAIAEVAGQVRKVRAAQTGTTTQENSWLLLAARAVLEEDKGLQLAVNGTPQTGQLQRVLDAAGLASPLEVKNVSDQPVDASIVISGAGIEPEPAAANGFQIERSIYTPAGAPATVDKVAQNDRFVIVLKVTEDEAKLGHVLIQDRLPAGFEIENPKLLQGADVKAFSWLKTSATPALAQFRDDRFTAAFHFTGAARKKPAEMMMAYVVRAVTPGHYTYPGATVEDMYRPGRFARTAPGTVDVSR